MRTILLYGSALAAAAQAANADVKLYPVQIGRETVRFDRGAATVDLLDSNGWAEVRQLPDDHGCMAFAVIFINKGSNPVTFGIENVEASLGTERLAILSRDQLVAKAKNRAGWAKFGNAVATSLVAMGQANTYETRMTGVVATPYAVGAFSIRDNSAGVQAASETLALGEANREAINGQLDERIANLSEGTLQTTTVYPGAWYGGRVVLAKARMHQIPQDLTIELHLGTGSYSFRYRITEQGHDLPPPFTNVATAVMLPTVQMQQSAAHVAQPAAAIGPGQQTTAPPAATPVSYRSTLPRTAERASKPERQVTRTGWQTSAPLTQF